MYLTLAAIHVTMAFVCHVGWALAFGRLRDLLQRPTAARVLNAGAGLALLLLAVRSLVKRLAVGVRSCCNIAVLGQTPATAMLQNKT